MHTIYIYALQITSAIGKLNDYMITSRTREPQRSIDGC